MKEEELARIKYGLLGLGIFIGVSLALLFSYMNEISTTILLILGAIFLILAVFSFYISRKRLNHIDLPGPLRILGEEKEVMRKWNVPQGEKYIVYLNERINEFVDDVNKYNKKINYIQGTGYLIAFLVSVIPLLLI